MQEKPTVRDALKQAYRSGVRFELTNGEIHFSAPEGMPQSIKRAIENNRDEFYSLLCEEQDLTLPRHKKTLGLCPVTWQQAELYLLHEQDNQSAVYNIHKIFEFGGTLPIADIETAWQKTIDQNPLLRTSFMSDSGQIKCKINNTVKAAIFNDIAESKAILLQKIEDSIHQAFKLNEAPLARLHLIQHAQKTTFIFVVHHIVADAFTVSQLLEDFSAAFLGDVESFDHSDDAVYTMADYASWQHQWLNSIEASCQKDYWQSKLAVVETVSLPIRNPLVAPYSGQRVQVKLSAPLAIKLNAFATKHATSEYAILFAAYTLLLHAYFNADEIVIGSAYSNRSHPKFSQTKGFLINPVLFSNSIDYTQSVLALIQSIQMQSIELQDQKLLPFGQVLSLADHEKTIGLKNFMFDYLVVNQPDELALGQSKGCAKVFGFQWAKVPLTLSFQKERGAFLGIFEWQQRFFDRDQINAFYQHFEHILGQLLEIKMLPQIEFRLPDEIRLIAKYNDTKQLKPVTSLLESFALRVDNNPHRIAIEFGETKISYQALDLQSNIVASYLLELGVTSGDIIGLSLPRSPDMFYAILGVLKAGAAYLPLDPTYPDARLRYMIQNSGIDLVFCDNTSSALFQDINGITVTVIKSLVNVIKNQQGVVERPINQVKSNAPAYVIYTSGSTGAPKGVVVKHKNLMNYLAWAADKFNVTSAAVFDFSTSLSFDLSVTCTLLPLFIGAKIVIANDEVKKDPNCYLKHLHDKKITYCKLTPSYFAQLIKFASKIQLDSLQYIILGGERLLSEVVSHWLSIYPDHTLVNEYGPTETTVATSAFIITAQNGHDKINGTYPIGFPACNTQMHVLNKHMKALPVGAVGELFIAGDSVASGYLNQPELTSAKFIDASGCMPHKRYKTGDLVSWSKESGLLYKGRYDEQVKVRGYRIELGEITATIQKMPDVNDAMVVINAINGHNTLVAYYVSDSAALGNKALLANVGQVLPAFMVPHYAVKLDRLPLTPNNKVDLKALPSPVKKVESEKSYVGGGQVIQTLLAIFQSVLGISSMTPQDNFFQLGGDSISALQVLAQAHEKGLNFAIKDLFDKKTMEGLLPQVSVKGSGNSACNTKKRLPPGKKTLLPIQEWFFTLNLKNENHWNQAVEIAISNTINIGSLTKALHKIYESHEALRCRFIHKGTHVIPEIVPQDTYPDLLEVLEHDSNTDDHAIKQLIAVKQASFTISEGRLFKALLLKNRQTQRLFLFAHHLCVDAVSWRIIVADLNRLYKAIASHLPVQSVKVINSIWQWAGYLSSKEQLKSLSNEQQFWQTQQEGPFGKIKHHGCLYQNTEDKSCELIWTAAKEQSHKLLKLSSELGVSPRDIILLAVVRALKEQEGANRWLFNMEHHGRTGVDDGCDFSGTVGWFTSMYPLAIELRAVDKTCLAELKYIRQTLLSVPHNGIHYQAIQERLSRHQPAALCFNYLGRFKARNTVNKNEPFMLKSTTIGYERAGINARPHLFDINSLFQGDNLEMHWIYPAALVSNNTINPLLKSVTDQLDFIMDALAGPSRILKVPADFSGVNVTQKGIDALESRCPSNYALAPATPIQQGFIFHHLHSGTSGDYLTQLSWELTGSLNKPRYKAAWQHIYTQFTVLRTGFLLQQVAMPLQFAPEYSQCPLVEYDWSRFDDKEQANKFAQLLREDRAEGFNITQPPLSRLYLIKLKEDKHKTLWAYDHTIMDGWSLSRMLAKVFSYYEGKPVIDSIDNQFFEYAKWLPTYNVDKRSRGKPFWSRYLRGITSTPTFPKDVVGTSVEVVPQAVYATLNKRLSKSIREFAGREGLTLNTIIQGCWAILLSHYSQKNDILFGVTLSGRSVPYPGIQKATGMFITTLPFRVHVWSEDNALEWLQTLQTNMREIAEYESLSQVEVGEISGKPIASLITTNIVFENYPVEDKILGNQEGSELLGDLKISPPTPHIQPGYPISLIIIPGPQLGIKIVYNSNMYTQSYIENLHTKLLLVLGKLSQQKASDTLEASILLLTKDVNYNANNIEVKFSDISTHKTARQCVFEMIEDCAKKNPHKVALMDDHGQVLTYSQMVLKIWQLAAYLRGVGVKPNQIIGLCCTRSIEAIIAMLAINKAGAAYVPIDHAMPQDRIDFIIKDASLACVVSHNAFLNKFQGNVNQIVILQPAKEDWGYPTVDALKTVNSPSDLMYVIYTSGSTGTPKGVLVEHAGVTNYVEWASQFFKDNPGDGVLLHSSLNFDITVTAVYPPLVCGHPLYIVDENRGIQGLIDSVLHKPKNKFSLIKLTPTHLLILRDAIKQDLSDCFNVIVIGGEALSAAHLERVDPTKCWVINHYGPTEATCGCCANLAITDVPNENSDLKIPIGSAITNMETYILDQNQMPAPIGAIGELYIAGPGLARGYLNLPDQTANSFVTPKSIGKRVYRSGDLVKQLDNGDLLFLGRADHQIKFNGYRIELGEIEAVLIKYGDIRKAAVMVKHDASANHTLVAFVEPVDFRPSDVEVKGFLKDQLPDYMVPAEVHLIDEMPMTGSGKIDRKSLDEILNALGDEAKEDTIFPNSDMEKIVHDVWCNVFNRDSISIQHNFFDIGGHSLRAIQLISQLNQALDTCVTIQMLFECPSIGALSKTLESFSAIQSQAATPGKGVEL